MKFYNSAPNLYVVILKYSFKFKKAEILNFDAYIYILM